VNEELGILELKKLLAAAQREILALKNQISISSPQFLLGGPDAEAEGETQSRSSICDEEDQELAPGGPLSIRVTELEELLESQRLRSSLL
jgi:hypothetical protein